MSIPKLKIYRLDEGYSQTRDSDIQSVSNDEMLPFTPKNLNPLDTEEMVGVKEHRESRLVVESDWKIMSLPMNRDAYEAGGTLETELINSEGWVTGKGNFKVFIKKQKLADYVSSSSSFSNSSSSSSSFSNSSSSSSSDYVSSSSSSSDYVSSSSSSSSFSNPSDELFNQCLESNGWYQVDRKLWDYTEQSIIKYYCQDDNGDLIETEDLVNDYVKYVYNVNHIKFRFGDLLTKTSLFFDNYNDYVKLVSTKDSSETAENRIFIMYKEYEQFYNSDFNDLLDINPSTSSSSSLFSNLYTLGSIHQAYNSSTQIARSIASEYSRYRVPFGNIYNGNKTGRCFYYNNVANTYIPDNVTVNDNVVHFYEGNYMYKKKVMPLRYMYAKQENDVSSSSSSSSSEYSFKADTLIKDGTCLFKADYDWFVDGLMKPVAMERMKVKRSDGTYRYIFKQLEQGLQIGMSYEDNSTDLRKELNYRISFLNSFYDVNGRLLYPNEVFLFYNKVDDSLGNIFDFNYDYGDYYQFSTDVNGNPKATSNKLIPWQNAQINEYGYANRGNLISSLNSNTQFLKDENGVNYVYRKNEILAIQANAGYERKRDLLLNYDASNHILSFQMPVTDTQISQRGDYYNSNFTDILGSKIYVNGVKIWDNTSTPLMTNENYTVTFEMKLERENAITKIPTWTIQLNGSDSSSSSSSTPSSGFNANENIPKDLMLVFYQKYNVFQQSEGLNQSKILGYRVPCYEKVKKSSLFVSSFPNWVKGHLNNDLDVFVGNQVYSGTTVDEKNLEAIYPAYCEDGWYAMYPQGAIQFANVIEQFDYFDIFNYGNTLGSNIIDFSTIQLDCFKALLPNTLMQHDTLDQNLKLYYNKVRYNVAHYDGIYSVVRSKLSNYSIQNGGVHYALLQDDDFAASCEKKWLIRDDNYIRAMYESGMSELPERVRISNQEQTSILTEFETKSGEFLRLNMSSNRIQMVNYIPSYGIPLNSAAYNDGFNNSMILCLNYTCDKSEKISLENLTKQDLRIHVKVDNYKLLIGLQHDKDCNLYNNSGHCTCGHCFGQQKIYIDQNYFTLSGGLSDLKVKWYELQPLQDSYTDKTIDDVQIVSQDIGENVNSDNGNAILKRYKFSMEEWYYDVYIEVFSFRYGQVLNTSDNKFPIYSVEYIVYKIDKY